MDVPLIQQEIKVPGDTGVSLAFPTLSLKVVVGRKQASIKERIFNTPHTLTMGRGAAKSGGGPGNGSAGSVKGGRKPKNLVVPTQSAGKVGACAALGNHIFTIGSGNKAQDGDTLCRTNEAMITYIGTQ